MRNLVLLLFRIAIAIAFLASVAFALYPLILPESVTANQGKPRTIDSSGPLTPEGTDIGATEYAPGIAMHWFRNSKLEVVGGIVAVGPNRPQMLVSELNGNIYLLGQGDCPIPIDGSLYVLSKGLKPRPTGIDIRKFALDFATNENWPLLYPEIVQKHAWN